MAPTRYPEPRRSGALAETGKKVVAGLVLVAVALIALKIIAGVVIGLVTTVFTIVLVAAIALAIVWAVRRL